MVHKDNFLVQATVNKIQQGSELFSAVLVLPFGKLGIRTAGAVITELCYLPPHFEAKAPQDATAELAAFQMEKYCADADYPFTLPLARVGTEFQHKVWTAISSIPRGGMRTYGELAKHIGSAPRAVGQACGANWFPVVVPCHRVTAASGLGGFSNSDDPNGYLLGIKRWLLAHEGSKEYAWQQTTLL
ncbi:methylated-DNA--[protein]-cysteine S-methyltransferase [Duganella sp. FT135W]|uniref:Methylated-DNA--[protein]-cysteine S-methyltransferase n=1 Tax=Duganella flavida TaxID=2692175 RepID=A0A6L8K9J7_9BURK|nr:methylated-DNA--[protein]-cysteine S-methyltransferase [Duganella flavida]MYM23297.1 methylated-DNA--[protein]-cysteine S-methyltransferase [Duganella flavida]